MKSILGLIIVFVTGLSFAEGNSRVYSNSRDTIVMTGSNYYFQGLNLVENEEWDEAIKSFEQALEMKFLADDIYDRLALSYRKVGNYVKAKNNCWKSIEQNPKGEKAHLYLATFYGMENQLDSAQVHYEIILALNEENADAYFGLANVNTIKEDFNAALIYGRKAMVLYEKTNSTRTGDSQYLVGILYYYKEDDENAKKYLTLAKMNGVELEVHLDTYLEELEEKKKLVTPEDFEKLEDDISTGMKFLMTSPANEQIERRTETCQFIIEWVSGAPDIHVTVTQKLVPYLEYGESLVIYIGAWADYCINGGDCEDKLAACLEATEQVIHYYLANIDELGKHKELKKMVKRQKKNKLEKYLKENLQ